MHLALMAGEAYLGSRLYHDDIESSDLHLVRSVIIGHVVAILAVVVVVIVVF